MGDKRLRSAINRTDQNITSNRNLTQLTFFCSGSQIVKFNNEKPFKYKRSEEIFVFYIGLSLCVGKNEFNNTNTCEERERE